MEREVVKEELARLKKEKDNRTYERLKLLLKAGKPKPESRAEENDVTNVMIETEDAIYERPNNIQNQPNMSDRNCQLRFSGGEGGGEDVTSKSTIQERTQDLNKTTSYMNNTSGGNFSSVTTELVSGSTLEDVLVISLGDRMEERESASTYGGSLYL